MYGLSTKRVRRRVTAHVAQIRRRIDALATTFSAEDEDPFIESMTDKFQRDVDRWEKELKELVEYYDEEVPL